MFSEDELKEMEKYAAEMKVLEVSFDVEKNTVLCDVISSGLGRNSLVKQVTLHNVPEEKIVKDTLSSIETVVLKNNFHFK